MNIQETAAVVAKIKLGDNREVNDLVLREWHDTIGHLSLAECMEAVRLHRQESSDYLMAAHVVKNVRRVRDERTLNRPEIEYDRGVFGPKPANFEAMAAAWNDPVAFAREVAIYDQQLLDAGFEPTQPKYARSWSE